jgi:uncharacterized protein (TIGR02246 family)
MGRGYSIGAIGWVFIALVLSGCEHTTSTAERSPPDRQADAGAIKALLTANFTASTARDAGGVVATFMPDGDGWIAGLSRAAGREEIREGEEAFVSLPGFEGYDGTLESIRFISRDAAIVEVSGTTSLDARKFGEETTIVVARTDEGWKIAAWRVMNFDERLLDMLGG